MAEYESIFQVRGSIGDLTFFTTADGKRHLRRATSLRGRRWWDHSKLNGTRERAYEFGGASKAASMIRSQFPFVYRKIALRYAHNELASAIRQHCLRLRERLGQEYPRPCTARTRGLTAFAAQGIANAIPGIQLGRGAGTHIPKVIADGGRYSIHGLSSTAQANITNGKIKDLSRCEFRIHICHALATTIQRPPRSPLRQAAFEQPDGRNDQPVGVTISSGWAPITGLNDDTDILELPLTELPEMRYAQPGDHILVFVGIEWRERTGRKSKSQPHMASFQGVETIPILPPGHTANRQKYRNKARERSLARAASIKRRHRPALRPDLKRLLIPHPTDRLQKAINLLAPQPKTKAPE